MFCVVFDKQLSDLAIFTSHLKPFKLSVNFRLKQKKGVGGLGQGEEGEGVFSSTASRRPRFQFSHSLTPYTGKAIEAAVQCCLPFGCHSAMTSTEISRGADENQTASPFSVLESGKNGRRLPGSLRC